MDKPSFFKIKKEIYMNDQPKISEYVSVFISMLVVYFFLYFCAIQFFLDSLYGHLPDLHQKAKYVIWTVLVIFSMACSYIVNNKKTPSEDE